MDEDLKNELLKILREMREGTPEAFAELVSQRSDYLAWLAAGRWLHVALIAAVAVVVVFITARVVKRMDRYDQELGVFVGCAVFVALVYLPAACVLPDAVSATAEAIAPLGRVLEMLR